ncbi:MAG: 30S ribosomal protein S6 [Candidatus Paceibacterota bacterium]|jgi:ribosomal protein S6
MEKEIKDNKVYEISYILVPSIAEEQVAGEEQAVKDLIISLGGVMITGETPRIIDLAYDMEKMVANKKQKFSEGYFGWLKFELTPETLLEFKKAVEANVKIIRSLIIKTVRENTYMPKRQATRTEGARKKFEPKEEIAGQMDEVAVDKEIDALVTE